jgi:hypothetical protein
MVGRVNMKNEKLLERLYEAKTNEISMNKLIDDIKEEIKKENLPKMTTKKQYNAIKRFLNQKHLRMIPVLMHTHLEKDYQVFTDSYMLFKFYGDEIIPQLPKTTDKENLAPYPKTEALCGILENDGVESEPFNVGELRKRIKTIQKTDSVKIVEFDFDSETKYHLDGLKLEKAFDILRLKNNENITFKYYQDTSIRPIGIKLKNREAIILPMRRD